MQRREDAKGNEDGGCWTLTPTLTPTLSHRMGEGGHGGGAADEFEGLIGAISTDLVFSSLVRTSGRMGFQVLGIAGARRPGYGRRDARRYAATSGYSFGLKWTSDGEAVG
jgi:hypothetical protein